MPALTIAPLSTAEAGVGAAGWASGSQTCSGTSPALMPKPATRSAMVRPLAAPAPRAHPQAACCRRRHRQQHAEQEKVSPISASTM
jgi:hypothetical protein